MSSVCEHIFEKEDPNNPGFSLTEFDLKAKTGLSLRKNLNSGLYEIFNIKEDAVVSRGTFIWIVKEANQREHSKNIIIKCRESCP